MKILYAPRAHTSREITGCSAVMWFVDLFDAWSRDGVAIQSCTPSKFALSREGPA